MTTVGTPKQGNDQARADFVENQDRALAVDQGLSATPKDMHWLQGNIPCQAACPAGTDIPGYLEAIYKGQFDDAYEINLRDNVFPDVLGRVCARPCESECRHGWEGNGESVAICWSKRAAGDMRAEIAPVVMPPLFDKTGKSVAVIGAGVAGLAAARELARMGHDVTVYEKHTTPGGMLRQGIPEFRLPREAIDREIAQVSACGVEIKYGVALGRDISMETLKADHDAVIIAAGTLKPNIPDLPGSALKGVEHGLDFLLEVNEFGRRTIGKKVVIIGGGYTAMDCARTAIRLGATGLKVYYRRREHELVILPEELVQLRQERGWMEFSCNPIAFLDDGDGNVDGAQFIRTKPGEEDSPGRHRAEPMEGSEFEVEADHIILATGQYSDLDLIDRPMRDEVDSAQRTSRRLYQSNDPDVFYAGDYMLGATSLIDAIGHAKETASAVDTYLMGSERLADAAFIQDAETTGRTRDMDFVPVHPMPTIPCSARSLTAEVEPGFTHETAQSEASRCYFCHYKFEIDNEACVLCDECLFVKPVENCIVEVTGLVKGPRGEIVGYNRVRPGETNSLYFNSLYIDQTQCIRCGACEEVCPTGAISIQKVSKVPATTDMLKAEEASPRAGAHAN
ncbi:MAG: FAD-dependent oxidoreductase [Pseudomonadota bacterium]